LTTRVPLRPLAVVLVVLLAIPGAVAAQDAKDAWAALVAGGHVAVIRHGNAPPGYGGDPPGFKIDDCTTQRNLDETGREQARALGANGSRSCGRSSPRGVDRARSSSSRTR
jgi:broad specificity phosphatase PhoE